MPAPSGSPAPHMDTDDWDNMHHPAPASNGPSPDTQEYDGEDTTIAIEFEAIYRHFVLTNVMLSTNVVTLLYMCCDL